MTEAEGQRDRRAFAALVVVQLVQVAAGLVTAPLLARALGPEGRGLLSAVQTPVGLAPYVGQFGLSAYAAQQVARGVRPGHVFGSLIPPLIVIGLLGTITGPFLARALAGDKAEVLPYLEIGLMLLPVILTVTLVSDIVWGLSRWRVVLACRITPPLVTLTGFVVLAVTGRLTVAAACVVTLVAAVSTAAVLVPSARTIGRPRFDAAILRRGLGFGLRAWPGTVASMANLRLDQLLMIPLLPARQLGLYATAVTVSGLGSVASSQVMTVAYPRIAARGGEAFTTALRISLLIALISQAAVCLATLLLFVPIFGQDFEEARALVYVLAIGGIAQSGVVSLGGSLTATGRPLAPTIGEFVALAVTVPGLLLALTPLGAMGAAIVSNCAYTASFAVQLRISLRNVDGRIGRYIPGGTDVRMLLEAARLAAGGAISRLRRRR